MNTRTPPVLAPAKSDNAIVRLCRRLGVQHFIGVTLGAVMLMSCVGLAKRGGDEGAPVAPARSEVAVSQEEVVPTPGPLTVAAALRALPFSPVIHAYYVPTGVLVWSDKHLTGVHVSLLGKILDAYGWGADLGELAAGKRVVIRWQDFTDGRRILPAQASVFAVIIHAKELPEDGIRVPYLGDKDPAAVARDPMRAFGKLPELREEN